MNFKKLQNLIDIETRKIGRAKESKNLALGIGAIAALGLATGIIFAIMSKKDTHKFLKEKAAKTIGNIEDTVRKDSETVKDFVAQSIQEVKHVIKDSHVKTEDVKKDIQDGFNETTEDINKAAENISNDIH